MQAFSATTSLAVDVHVLVGHFPASIEGREVEAPYTPRQTKVVNTTDTIRHNYSFNKVFQEKIFLGDKNETFMIHKTLFMHPIV